MSVTESTSYKAIKKTEKEEWSIKNESIITLKRLVFLHLAPGIVVLAMIILFSQQIITNMFGIDKRLGPVFGFVMGSAFVSIELLYLYYLGKKKTNSYSLKGVIHYTEKNSKKEYMLLLPALTLFILVFFIVIAPIFQPFFENTFFWWWPKEFNFQSIFQNQEFLSSMNEMKGIQFITIMYILFPALLMPLIEELYFRGYLMYELDKKYGVWSVVINSVLFSLYHFFSPWENFVRIFAVTGISYIAYTKKNIRLSLVPHVVSNFLGAIILVVVIYGS